jgi:GNAT superfamily N-acetyltransferase
MEGEIRLRPACAEDQKTIRRIIHNARINPLSLDWHHFILAVDKNDRILGTGQIKTHGDGTRELASIAVIPEFQRKGIASRIILHLLERNPPPLYLTCRASLGPFYEKFGFVQFDRSDLKGYFSRLHRIGSLISRLGLTRDGMLVMGKIK